MAAPLKLYNTLTRSKGDFEPIDAKNVRLYVCGPTVYDFAHIGNARPVIVFDVLNRVLRYVYGQEHVTYVRNITDVDDKINARAVRDFPNLPINEAISQVTQKTTAQFHEDVAALNCLSPDQEPRATDYINHMAEMAQDLINKGHAYVARGKAGREVLFQVDSMADYGKLSNRNMDDQKAGARIAVEDHKKNAADFVLWKESLDTEPGWEASFSQDGDTQIIRGRPGWHIECSVMAKAHLGVEFDIHGGGLDLIFPHHENEIAQSRCCHGTDHMAKVWMHNGFLQLEGKKMSKSDGNFVTISALMRSEKFGGQTWAGEVLRMAMLMTHYREPIDFSVKRLKEAEAIWKKWPVVDDKGGAVAPSVLDALSDDLNTVAAIQALHVLAGKAHESDAAAAEFAASAALMGLLPKAAQMDDADMAEIEDLVAKRLCCLDDKDWGNADALRDQLTEKGVILKDGKDPETGKRITDWELKR